MWIPHQQIASDIERFIRERFDVKPSDTVFARTVSLWQEGYVDSTGVVEVIAFLESTFAIVIPDEALFSQAFTNIDGMARWVLELQGRKRAVGDHHG